MAKVAPSILSANFGNLSYDVKRIVDAGCEFLHFDVMDGHFVPNISFGATILKDINSFDIIYDVHLMISDPLKYAIDFQKAGADYITFHYEAVLKEDIPKVINHIKSLGVKVGISIKPNTSVEVLDPYLADLDLVLVMSVEPGFGGQKFMENSLSKIQYLSNKKKENNYKYLIEVDGGINQDTSVLAVKAGAEVLVAGTYVFKSNDLEKTVEGLKKL